MKYFAAVLLFAGLFNCSNPVAPVVTDDPEVSVYESHIVISLCHLVAAQTMIGIQEQILYGLFLSVWTVYTLLDST